MHLYVIKSCSRFFTSGIKATQYTLDDEAGASYGQQLHSWKSGSHREIRRVLPPKFETSSFALWQKWKVTGEEGEQNDAKDDGGEGMRMKVEAIFWKLLWGALQFNIDNNKEGVKPNLLL